MIAGKLNIKITIFQPEETINDFGETQRTDTKIAEVYAERVRYTGRKSEEAGEHFPDYVAQWNIRDAHTIKENWRVKGEDGYLYTVTNIIHNRQRGMKTLICERVNE